MKIKNFLKQYSKSVKTYKSDVFKGSYVFKANNENDHFTEYEVPIENSPYFGKIVFEDTIDSRRGVWVTVISKYINFKDIAIIQLSSGREGDDYTETYVLDEEVFEALMTFGNYKECSDECDEVFHNCNMDSELSNTFVLKIKNN